MDLELTEEQKLLRETARDFATKEVLPKAAAIDRDHRYPKELVAKMGENIKVGYDRDAVDAIRDDRSKLIIDMCALVDRGIICRDDAAAQLGFEERGGASAVPTVANNVMPLDAVVSAVEPSDEDPDASAGNEGDEA